MCCARVTERVRERELVGASDLFELGALVDVVPPEHEVDETMK